MCGSNADLEAISMDIILRIFVEPPASLLFNLNGTCIIAQKKQKTPSRSHHTYMGFIFASNYVCTKTSHVIKFDMT